MARGIALESITDSTKISSRHLVALERSDFDNLPGGVFNKGIVRGYARAVGLDEDAWVGRFLAAYHATRPEDNEENWTEFAENVRRNRVSDGHRPDLRLRWAGVFVLLALLAGLGWIVWHYVSQRVSIVGGSQPHSVSRTWALTAPDSASRAA